MGVIQTTSPKRGKGKRTFTEYTDRANNNTYISASLWNRFDIWCRKRGTLRSRMVEKLIEEEMGTDGHD